MPRLADCIGLNVADCSVRASQMVRFAYLLGVSLSRAQELFTRHGSNYAYSRSGFAVPHTQRETARMVRIWGWCVAFGDDGTPYVVHGTSKRDRQKRRARTAAREQEQIKRTEEAYAEHRRLMRLCHDGQTHPSPKRGGKANSHEDIGKYNYIPSIRLSDTETRCAWRTYQIK